MKKYFLSVPVMSFVNSTPEQQNKTLFELERCKADRVFLSFPSLYADFDLAKYYLDVTEKNVKFFKEHGLEVGVWINSAIIKDENTVAVQVGDSGRERSSWLCQADEELLAIQEEYARRFAEMGIDLLMYDDDFHFGYGAVDSVPGCFCRNHRKLFEEQYGDTLDFDRIKEEFWKEPKNEYRDAWLRFTGSTLENFAKRIRAAINKVNPDIRIGFCVNGSDYWSNGTSVQALCKAFAGNTKPFVRLIGAPYHDLFMDYPSRLSSAIELERFQAEILKDSGIEVMTEGDTFPRPRTATPAAHLECFDMIMRANGNSSGILKYMLDYHSPADYETGYVDHHIENSEAYRFIEDNFAKKTAKGVRCYQFPDKFSETEWDKYSKRGSTLNIMPFMSCMLAQLSIPTTYEGMGIAGVVFGENAKFLDEKALSGGIVTDIPGAQVLSDMGIDVGLKSVDGDLRVVAEDFGEGIIHRILGGNDGYYSISIDEKAKVLSHYFEAGKFGYDYNMRKELKNVNVHPAAYLYENANKQRFCVLAFDVRACVNAVKMLKESFRSYAKAIQLSRAFEWVGGQSLPVKSEYHPDLYLMCKEDASGTAIGVWNLSKDKIQNLKLSLDKRFDNAEFYGAVGVLSDKEIRLNTTLYPYEFCGILLK